MKNVKILLALLIGTPLIVIATWTMNLFLAQKDLSVVIPWIYIPTCFVILVALFGFLDDNGPQKEFRGLLTGFSRTTHEEASEQPDNADVSDEVRDNKPTHTEVFHDVSVNLSQTENKRTLAGLAVLVLGAAYALIGGVCLDRFSGAKSIGNIIVTYDKIYSAEGLEIADPEKAGWELIEREGRKYVCYGSENFDYEIYDLSGTLIAYRKNGEKWPVEPEHKDYKSNDYYY